MTTATATVNATPTSRLTALAAAETRLVLRNRTLLVSTLIVPVGLGLFWALTFRGQSAAAVLALQLAVAIGMGLYVTATQTLVARRQAKVLKRLRTTSVTDTGLLVGVVAPSVVIAFGQIVLFVVIDAVVGIPVLLDPLALVLATVGGLAMAVAAAIATAVITPSAERAQITTMPLTFLLLGGAIAMAFIPLQGWWQALLLLPGASIGALARHASEGSLLADGILPALLPIATLVLWTIVLARFAATKFRWDPRV